MPNHDLAEIRLDVVGNLDETRHGLSELKRHNLWFAMERGSLSVVRYLVHRDGMAFCSSLLPYGELDAWLEKAGAYEAVHGDGSFLVAGHRFNAELLPCLDRQAAGEHVAVRDLPAPFWSMELGWHGA